MTSQILEKFFRTLPPEEQRLIADYIHDQDPEVLSKTFDELIMDPENEN